MDVVLSASFGILFLVVGCATVFLMYYLWGFPFDHATHTSAAPRSLMRLHRILGYVFVVIYLVMMREMVPRMWQYQVEWPARTVAHMMFGMSIGVVLIVKLTILRWFRHFEEWMPVLGTLLLVFTLMLSGLSMPHAFREMALASEAAGGDVLSDENRARVAALLPTAGLPPEAPLADLASVEALQAGRMVLLRKCVVCHDLKTILVRPRSPTDWVNTVERMALKPAFAEPISEMEQWQSSAYLIAISRELQRSARERRQEKVDKQNSQQAMADAAPTADTAQPAAPTGPIDEKKAQETYESVCAQCHELSEVDKAPPRNAEEVAAVIKRMIDDNDLKAEKSELEMIEWYMNKKFASGG
jgi:mono/diheme cytochrome c family protein